MNAQYFVYTRGSKIENDYKLVFSPSDDFCSPEIRKYFKNQVRGVINIEEYEDNLKTTPRWFLSKKDGYTLWGVGTLNKMLSDSNNADYQNRPVRGFFGILIKDSTPLCLPYDLSFFKEFYKNYLFNIWYESQTGFKKKGIAVTEDIEKYTVISSKKNECTINTDSEKTVIWSDSTAPEDLFSAAISIKENFSCVCGLSAKEHAYKHEYLFNNAIVEGIKITEEKTYKKKVIVSVPGKKYEDIPDPVIPKKDYRLKLILAIAAVVTISIIVIRCCQSNQTNPKPSISGDSVQTMKDLEEH